MRPNPDSQFEIIFYLIKRYTIRTTSAGGFNASGLRQGDDHFLLRLHHAAWLFERDHERGGISHRELGIDRNHHRACSGGNIEHAAVDGNLIARRIDDPELVLAFRRIVCRDVGKLLFSPHHFHPAKRPATTPETAAMWHRKGPPLARRAFGLSRAS